VDDAGDVVAGIGVVVFENVGDFPEGFGLGDQEKRMGVCLARRKV
jgi:hypothetical protein